MAYGESLRWIMRDYNVYVSVVSPGAIKTAMTEVSYLKGMASQLADVEGMAKANQSLGTALSRLLIVQEKYPELKANSNFQTMMSDLKDGENQIQYTRQFYNDIVLKYNNKCEMFPSIIIAKMFGFKAAKFFEVTDEAQREAPKVQF